ncbi:MAG: hypothetical protein NT175_10185 [Bacteroidetes bacterium]|nr:hypothetical protein [Bacteroidota bacterium]
MNQMNVNTELKLEPTVDSTYGFGWEVMKKNFLELFLLILVMGVASVPFAWISALDDIHNPGVIILRLFSLAYVIFVYFLIQYGATFLFLKAVRGYKVEIKDLRLVFDNYLNVILAGLLTSAIIMFGLFLVLIPGIIFACKLAFVPYLVVDRKLDPVEAVKTSWNMTRGHAWTIFLMALLGVLIFIAGFICLFVGSIISMMWIGCASAALFYVVNNRYGQSPEMQEKVS